MTKANVAAPALVTVSVKVFLHKTHYKYKATGFRPAWLNLKIGQAYLNRGQYSSGYICNDEAHDLNKVSRH